MTPSNKLDSYLPVPTKQKFAATFRTVSRFSFWTQLALGGFSGIVLLLAIFSRNSTTTQTDNPAIGLGIFLGIAGIMLIALLIWGISTLVSLGINEKTLIIIIFGGIASFGLIGRIVHVAKDSRK